MMAREETEFTTEPEAGVLEQSNQETRLNDNNTGNQKNPASETTESPSDKRDTQTIIKQFLKDKTTPKNSHDATQTSTHSTTPT